jgi:UDP-galactopyranose mutase
MKKYDYLVVGSGLYGAVFAHEARKAGKSVLVIDKRPNIAGNVYTEDINMVHIYSIQITKKYGIILHSSQSLTVLRIHRWLIIRVNCIHFLLICIHLIRCGE